MRAAVLLGGGRCAVAQTPAAAPAPDEVLLRLEGCGVCASNLPVWEGREWFGYPLDAGSPGHEPWGRVVERGEAVSDLEIGARVTGLSYRAYAECDIARADQLVQIPERYDGRPFPGEALACAMNVFDRAAIEPDMEVAVVGAGFIGGVVVQVAAAAGAKVTAFSRRQWSLERAREQGAHEARPLDEGVAAARDSGAGWARVVECTGTQSGLDAASRLVGVGGRLVIAGYHQEGLRQVDMQEWNWKGIDVVNAHEREPARYTNGIRAALGAIERGHLDPWPLFTHEVELDSIDTAFRLMQQRPDGFTKALLAF